MAGAKEAGGVGDRAGSVKGAAAGRGIGLALTLAVAALAAGAVGGCQAPAPFDEAQVGAAPLDEAQAGATPDGAAVDLAATRAECKGKGCEARAGGEANLMPACAPGSPKCDPELNGVGVFVARDGQFCLPSYWPARYCVRSFINDPGGIKVKLAASTSDESFEWNVTASFRPEGFALPQLNSLASITTDKGRLVIKYRRLVIGGPSPVVVVPDDKLRWVWLEFTSGPATLAWPTYQLRFEPAGSTLADGPSPRESIGRYRVSFRVDPESSPPSSPWSPFCTDAAGAQLSSSVLGGNEIDPRSARVFRREQSVTLSCVTGAIDTCLTWGYAPWAGEADGDRASLFSACLQAKRAAYYVGKGDLGSYTKPGTPILLRDMFGIHNDPINDASLEAVWTSGGAKCFNWNHRRRPEMLTSGHPDEITMPACPPGVGLGFLSTGKATQSDTTD